MSSLRSYISSFLFTLLLVVQLGGLHALDHDEDVQNCEVCLVLQTVQSQDILPAAIAQAPLFDNIQLPVQVVSGYYAFAKAETPEHKHTTRPPPSLI